MQFDLICSLAISMIVVWYLAAPLLLPDVQSVESDVETKNITNEPTQAVVHE